MAFITLQSENEKFSWILEKNPETQKTAGEPFRRNSKIYSNYLWFENDNKISVYSKIMNENNPRNKIKQLDFTQNTKGEVYLQMIDNILRSALNKENELDTVPATLEFTLYNFSELDYKERMPDLVVECDTVYKHSKIKIVAPSVKKALETCCVISLITSFYEKDYYIEDAQYLKYLKFAIELTSEYSLIRQMVSFIKSPALYDLALPFIEQTPFNVMLPRAFDARRNFYKTQMMEKTTSKELLELGCGEGDYFKTHIRHYETVNSVEPDADVYNEAHHARRKIRAEDIINLHFTDAMSYLSDTPSLEGVDVLMTEVVEHIEFVESIRIINTVLEKNPNMFLVTIPNHEFNKHYGYKPGEFRHDDHLWEPTIAEFESIVAGIKETWGPNFEVTDHYLGDHLKSNPKNCATFAILIKAVK